MRAKLPDAGQRDFGDFVDSRREALVRLALLITRNWDEGEDAVQDALASLYPRWTELPAGRDLDRYVNRAVVNACLKRLRRTRTVPVAELEWLAADDAGDPGSSVVLARHAWQLCAELAPTQRAAVVLRFYQDLSFADIAEVLGCGEATARSHVHRAVAALRARHQQEAGDD